MRRLIITATTVLALGCLTAGCAASARQPPALFGSPMPSSRASSSRTAAMTPAATSSASLGSSQLAAAISAAAAQAAAVHLTGTVTSVATPLTLDVHLNKDGTSSGTLGYQGATIPFRVTGGLDYFQLTPSFMSLSKMSQTSAEGEWVTSTSSHGEPLVTVFSQFLTYKEFVSKDVVGNNAAFTFTFMGTGQLDGQHVAVYQVRSGTGPSITYDIAADGPVLPLKISGGDNNNAVDLQLTWNQPTTVTAPPTAQIYTC
jgi:hypothetical protein